MRSDLIGNCYFWREYYVHSIANHATCSRTFSWPQTEDSTVSIFQMWSAFFSPLQCLEKLECSHFYFKLKPFKDWGKQENTHTCSHLFSIALSYYQPQNALAMNTWQKMNNCELTKARKTRFPHSSSLSFNMAKSASKMSWRNCLRIRNKNLQCWSGLFEFDERQTCPAKTVPIYTSNSPWQFLHRQFSRVRLILPVSRAYLLSILTSRQDPLWIMRHWFSICKKVNFIGVNSPFS